MEIKKMIRNLFFVISTLLVFYKFSEHVYRVRDIKFLSKQNAGDYFKAKDLEIDIKKLNKEAFLRENKYTRLPTASGGLNGIVTIYYISLCEVLVLYQSPRGCVGFTGRDFMNTSVTTLTGELRYAGEMAEGKMKVLSPGELHVFRSGTRHAIEMTPNTTLLLYSRGFVPYTVLAVVYDLVQTSFDPLLALQTFEAYAQHITFGNKTILDYLKKLNEKFWLVVAKTKHFITNLYTEYCPRSIQNGVEELYPLVVEVCSALLANVYASLLYVWKVVRQFGLDLYSRVYNMSS